jgi:hydrogenase maturation protease
MQPKIILIGLGNPILGDDGVGWKVVEYIQKHRSLPDEVETDCLALGGISLMERLVGYEQAILVDAIITKRHPIGSVLCFEIDELPNQAAGHLSSTHDTTLPVALEMGKSLGAHLPDRITIVAVESQSVYEFSEELSPAVNAAVTNAAEIVMNLIV